MNGIHTTALGQVNDGGNIQIGRHRALILTDQIRLIGVGTKLAVNILVGVHRHRVEAQVIAGPEYADCNLSTVCGQHLVKGFLCHIITSNS